MKWNTFCFIRETRIAVRETCLRKISLQVAVSVYERDASFSRKLVSCEFLVKVSPMPVVSITVILKRRMKLANKKRKFNIQHTYVL